MITVTAILLILSLTHLDEGRLRPSAITFAGFLLAALIFALLSVLPKFPFPGQRRRERRAPRDLLFFNHVAAMPQDEYVREMAGVLENDSPPTRRSSGTSTTRASTCSRRSTGT
jgi:Family of unknown function (DUF5706)